MTDWTWEYVPDAARVVGGLTAAQIDEAERLATRIADVVAVRRIGTPLAVAVIGVEERSMPAAAALAPEDQDPLAYDKDLQRERCVLFVACIRARDHLFVSHVSASSPFLRLTQLMG